MLKQSVKQPMETGVAAGVQVVSVQHAVQHRNIIVILKQSVKQREGIGASQLH